MTVPTQMVDLTLDNFEKVELAINAFMKAKQHRAQMQADYMAGDHPLTSAFIQALKGAQGVEDRASRNLDEVLESVMGLKAS